MVLLENKRNKAENILKQSNIFKKNFTTKKSMCIMLLIYN